MQTSERTGARRLMQCYRTREGGTLLSYRPCMVDESEVNAAGKLNTRNNREKELLTTMTRLRLECLVHLWWVFSVHLFDSNPNSHNSQGADWLLRHSKLMTLYTVFYEIKYTATGLSCVYSKIQQLCLIHYALDLGDTCWDELLVAWFLQVQQILSNTTNTCLVLARSRHSWLLVLLMRVWLNKPRHKATLVRLRWVN